MRRLIAALLLGSALCAGGARAADEPKLNPGDVIDFAADRMDYDQNADIVTANGNVLIVREGYRLRSNSVAYNRKTGQVLARGDVVVIDPGGNQAFGDTVEVSDTLRDAAIQNILIVLQDGGRLAARSATRVNEVSTLNRAVYSPCDIIGADGCPRTPLWQIKAVRVVHNPAKHRLSYRQAYFEFFGVPLLYLPSFSHPDGGAGNAGGLLGPDFRLSRSLGAEIDLPYYYAFAPNSDVTVTPHLYTEVNPALAVDYRLLTGKGPISVGGIGTVSERVTAAGTTDDGFRGYFYANGKLQHTADWRSTFGVRLTTDDTFPRRYDVSRDVTLRNYVNVEHFAADSYLTVAGWGFQTLRLGQKQGLQPIALPAAEFDWRPDLLGGKLQVRANSLDIVRTDGQDTQRALASVRWDLSRLTPLGQRVTLTAMGRGDVYHMNDTADASVAAYAGREGWESRLLGAAAVDVEWPFAGPAFGGMQTWTPRVQLVASSDGRNNRFANEDARAVDLDDLDLFDINRFPGYDRWESGARVTYGGRWALDRPRVSIIAEAGQSYRLDSKAGIFPNGTGLSDRLSDYVGRTTIRFGRQVDLTHRWRLDKDSFKVRRNEVDLTVGGRRTYAQIGYSRLNRDIAVEDLPDRQEVRAGARVQLTRFWSVFGSTILDLTTRGDDPASSADGFDPIRHRVGFLYEDECLQFGLTWRRDYTQVRDVKRGNIFLLTLALKNLGR